MTIGPGMISGQSAMWWSGGQSPKHRAEQVQRSWGREIFSVLGVTINIFSKSSLEERAFYCLVSQAASGIFLADF